MREPVIVPTPTRAHIEAEWAAVEITARDREEALSTLVWAMENAEVIDWAQYPVGVRAAVRQIITEQREVRA